LKPLDRPLFGEENGWMELAEEFSKAKSYYSQEI
jgi:hypothetical protein